MGMIKKINQMINRNKASILTALLIFLMMEACYYNVRDFSPVETPDTVSFANDIIPIFETGCATSGCHATGGIPPDLSTANAFTSLTVFGYVEADTTMAEQSLIYEKINTGSMAKYASDQDRALLLKWIEQGARNN